MSATKATKRKIRLKNLKEYKTIWHPESTLVYKSRKERLVIGRYVDGEIIPLDEEALELCEEWNMKPDESLLETGSSPGDYEQEKEEEQPEREEESKNEDEESRNEDEESEDKDTANVKVSDQSSEPNDIQDIVNQYTEYSKTFITQLMSASKARDNSNSAKFSAKQEECDQLRAELNDLQAKYDVIKKKFDTMKSLFA